MWILAQLRVCWATPGKSRPLPEPLSHRRGGGAMSERPPTLDSSGRILDLCSRPRPVFHWAPPPPHCECPEDPPGLREVRLAEGRGGRQGCGRVLAHGDKQGRSWPLGYTPEPVRRGHTGVLWGQGAREPATGCPGVLPLTNPPGALVSCAGRHLPQGRTEPVRAGAKVDNPSSITLRDGNLGPQPEPQLHPVPPLGKPVQAPSPAAPLCRMGSPAPRRNCLRGANGT